MSITWTEDLATGSFLIDSQHKRLFQIINQLLNTSKDGKSKEATQNVLTFLENYVNEHFSTEEEFMERYNYPHIAYHKKLHNDFKRSFEKYKKKAHSEGITLSLTVSLTHSLAVWLTKHIRGDDKELANFLMQHLK